MPETDEFVNDLTRRYRSLPLDDAVDPEAVRTNVRRRRRAGAGGVLASMVLLAGLGAGTVVILGDEPEPDRQLPVQQQAAAAMEMWPSDSASDWVAWADVVVVGTVTAEERGASHSVDSGTDEAFVSRSVTVAIDDRLWSQAGIKVPGEITLEAAGWSQSGGELTARLVLGEGPRLEVGHTYVLALLHDTCGNPWMALGSAGALPSDDAMIGNGELAGRGVSAAEGLESRSTLLKQTAGKRPAAVASALVRAEADPEAVRREATC